MDTRIKKLFALAVFAVIIYFIVSHIGKSEGTGISIKIAIVGNDNFTLGSKNDNIQDLIGATLANRLLATLLYPPFSEYWVDEKISWSEFRRESGSIGYAGKVSPIPYVFEIKGLTKWSPKIYVNYSLLVQDRSLSDDKIAASFNTSMRQLVFSRYFGEGMIVTCSKVDTAAHRLMFEIPGRYKINENTIYHLTTVAHPLENARLRNYGFYNTDEEIKEGSNVARLVLKAKGDSTKPNLVDSLLHKVKIDIRTNISKKELTDYAVIIHPGYPEDILGGNFPESYVPYVIPYGYTYIAVVRNKELDPHAVYGVLESYAEKYLLEKVGLDGSIAERFIEKWWIPRSWLMLGRATDIKTAIYDDSFSYYPAENSLSFTVGVYTGSGTQVQPINFQNFHSLFFEGNPKVFAVQSTKDIDSKNPDVVIYKATFDPNFDSPGIIYDFAKSVIPGVELWRDINLFNMSMLLYDPSDREVVDRAWAIQSYLNNYYMMAFPIFSEPITVIIDTTRVRNFALNYRHILSGFYNWKWEAQR